MVHVSNFNDVIREFASSIVSSILYLNDEEDESAVREIAPKIAAAIIAQGNSTLDFAGLNDSWHKAGNRIPDELRPYHAMGDWSPLFNGEIDLGGGYSIRELNSQEQLREESRTLDHCVGYGSYAQSCLRGSTHVL